MAYWDKNEYDLALADFNKALSIKPDYVIALNNRGMFYLDKEEYDLAIADFKKAKRLNRTNAQDKNNPSRYRF
jgi:tetratricopeptide (TPR) repeat protein